MNIVGTFASRMRWIGAAQTLASAVAHSLMSRVSILIMNMITGVIVSRTLGPAGRGTSGAIVLLPLLISGLLSLGVPAALRYDVRRRAAEPAEIFSAAVLISGVLGLIAFIIGFSIAPHFLARYPPSVTVFAKLMMFFAPPMLTNATLQAFYESRGDFKRSNAMIYVPPAVTVVGLLALYALHKMSPFAVAITYEFPMSAMTLTTLWQLRRFLKMPRRIGERIRSLLHYGFRAYGIDILNTLASQIDQAMVVGLLSASSFGLYAVAISGARILQVMGASLNSVLFPTASGLDKVKAIELVSRSARLVFACTLVAAIVFSIALPMLIPLAFGKAYLSAVPLTRILVVAVLFAATTSTFNQAFMATGRPEIATIPQCVGVCITIPLMLVLIPKFGLWGAAYAVVVSNVIRFILVMISYPLFLRQRIPSLLPTQQDMRDLLGRVRRAAVS